jgi:serine/threonine protein kinase
MLGADLMPTALVEVPRGYRAGGWEIEKPIASGSWASVYAARRVVAPRDPDDPPQDARGALKFLPGATLSPAQRADLEEAVSEEVRFHEQADHPRLIRTFETFVVDDPEQPAVHGALVLAMERASTSLHDLLRTVTPPQPVPDAARLICEICEALAHMHASGWVHGDLKPSNVLLMDDGTVRLADFGLARELEGTHAYAPRLGSSDYLPPEWWTERIGPEGIATRTTVDIWALGVTAHQLLTGGMLPFPGATARARGAAAQAYAAGQAQLRLAGELPPAWRPIVADCLAPDHERRSAHSAASILERIHRLADGGEPAPVRIARRALPGSLRARAPAPPSR